MVNIFFYNIVYKSGGDKLRNIKITIILVIIILSNGCSLSMSNMEKLNSIDSPIEIYVENDYGSSWSHVGLYSTFLDDHSSKLYILKEDKIFSVLEDYNYWEPILSPDGEHFLAIDFQRLNQNEKYIFYLFNTKTREKEFFTEVDFYQEFDNQPSLSSIIWNEEGIYALSKTFGEDNKLISSNLIMLDRSSDIEVIWENPPFSSIEDIVNNWVLYYTGEDYIAHNILTKESIVYEIFQKTINGLHDYRNLKFLQAPMKLVGSKIYNYNEYYTFIYSHEEGNITRISDGQFIGFSTSGFAYKKYTGNENKHIIYIKPFDFK